MGTRLNTNETQITLCLLCLLCGFCVRLYFTTILNALYSLMVMAHG